MILFTIFIEYNFKEKANEKIIQYNRNERNFEYYIIWNIKTDLISQKIKIQMLQCQQWTIQMFVEDNKPVLNMNTGFKLINVPTNNMFYFFKDEGGLWKQKMLFSIIIHSYPNECFYFFIIILPFGLDNRLVPMSWLSYKQYVNMTLRGCI